MLLVEDSPTDRALVEGLLRHPEHGSFEVAWAGTLGDAVDLAGTGGFDAVLLDLFLPDGEGIDTFLTMRDAAPDVPIVVVTGAEDTDIGLRCVQAGAQDFLTKGRTESRRLAEALIYAVERWYRNREQALYDPLTGLATKHLLLHRLAEATARTGSEGGHLAVLTVDLGIPAHSPDAQADGRATSDLVAAAAERIRAALRPFDILARTGFQTFAAVVPGLTRPANAERAGQRVLGALVGELPVGPAKVRLQARVGVAWGRPAEAPVQLLDRAWAAAYELKKADAPGLRVAPAPAAPS